MVNNLNVASDDEAEEAMFFKPSAFKAKSVAKLEPPIILAKSPPVEFKKKFTKLSADGVGIKEEKPIVIKLTERETIKIFTMA